MNMPLGFRFLGRPPRNISLKRSILLLATLVFLVVLFLIAYSYHYAYKKIIKSKCKICKKKLDNKFKRVRKYM